MRSAPWIASVLLLVLLGLTAPSCKQNPEAGAYDAFAASNFGIGVRFNELSAEVLNEFGEPLSRTERLSGASAEWHYMSKDSAEAIAVKAGKLDVVVTPEVSQLSLTFHNDKLVSVYNRYYHDKSQPDPPYFIEPVVGVKLGNRLSDFEQAIGRADSDTVGREWRFTGDDDSTVRVVAHFVPLTEGSSELICNVLQVSWSPPLVIDRGEDLQPTR